MKFIIAAVCFVAGLFIALLVMSTGTELVFTPAVGTIGYSTPVTVQVSNPHGVRQVTAYLEQNGVQFPLYEENAPAHRFFWGRHQPARSITFVAGKNKAKELKDGAARLVVEAVSNDLRGSTDSASSDVKVVLTAPHVLADGFQHYINQAGMELVTFSATGNFDESGVRVGNHTFRSFPLPGRGSEQRFAMFAYPWDAPPDLTPVVYARSSTGAEDTARFWFKLFPKKFRERDFLLDDSLMTKLVNNIDPAGTLEPGPDMLTRFVKINSDMRRRNNQQLYDLRNKTEEKILWEGPFVHYGKEEALFADTRDYKYAGKQVDRQTHLGFDLSDVANAPVNAANTGRVVWADNLGIYGNCVVLDHGYGLQSIYGHLQRIDVRVGDLVKKGGKMGIAGSTGLAEGVHVHFGMQIDGVQINPREWWDEHWIHDRILSKLEPVK